MKNRKFDKIAIIVVFSFLIIGMSYTLYKQNSVSKFEVKTTGQIIKFEYLGTTRYGIDYIYTVNGKAHEGTTGVEYFKCDNGKEGCVGSTFDVFYSSENPQFSRIHLGKYNEHQTTVQFFE